MRKFTFPPGKYFAVLVVDKFIISLYMVYNTDVLLAHWMIIGWSFIIIIARLYIIL